MKLEKIQTYKDLLLLRTLSNVQVYYYAICIRYLFILISTFLVLNETFEDIVCLHPILYLRLSMTLPGNGNIIRTF